MKAKKLLAGTAALVSLFALASCENGETPNPEPTPDPVVVEPGYVVKPAMSYADYAASKDGTEVVIEGYIADKCTWYNNAASFYLTDDNGGYYIYNMTCTQEEYEALAVGKLLHVTGEKASWKGQAEIDFGKASENQGWKLYDVTKEYDAINVSNIAKETLDAYANRKVKTPALTVTKAAYTNFETFALETKAGADVYFEVTDGTTTATYVVEAYLSDTQYNSTTYNAVAALKVGDKVQLEGFVYYYNAPQVQVTKVTKVNSYAEYAAAADGTEVTVEAYVTDKCTWYKNAASFYLADDNGGYYVYNMSCTQAEYDALTVGKKLVITGEKASWKGQAEIDFGKASENQGWLLEDGTKAYDAVAVNDIAKATLDAYVNRKVKTPQLTVTKAAYTNFETFALETKAGADVYFEVTDGTTTATYVVEAYLLDTQFGSDTYNAVAALKVGDVITLEGFVYYYNAPQLQVTKVTK